MAASRLMGGAKPSEAASAQMQQARCTRVRVARVARDGAISQASPMSRRPKNTGQFRKRFVPDLGRDPKMLRFETRGQRKGRHKRTVLLAVGAFLMSVAAGIGSLWLWPTAADPGANQPVLGLFSSPDTAQPAMELCGAGQRHSCVVDGDTIWLEGEKIRIADIDTPEIGEPACQAEYRLGMRATHRLRDLLNEGPWSVEPIGSRDSDRFGRSLRVLTRNGRSIGDRLVEEGLARTWNGRRSIR